MANVLRAGSCLLAAILLLLAGLSVSVLAGRQKTLKVAIDVGHTKKRPGATSARGRSEYYFNRDLAKTLLETLNARDGIQAFLVNPSETEITLEKRPRSAESKGADLLLSIHHDSVQPGYLQSWYHNGKKKHYCDRFSGHSLFVSLRNGAPWTSYILAYLIGDSLELHQLRPTLHHAEKVEGENRELLNTELGIYRFDNLVVLHKATIPAVLLECGVIVNRQEEQTVSNAHFKTTIATSIADALADFKNLYADAKKEDYVLYRAPIELSGTIIQPKDSGPALCARTRVCLPLCFQKNSGLRSKALSLSNENLTVLYQGVLDYYGAGSYQLLHEQQK